VTKSHTFWTLDKPPKNTFFSTNTVFFLKTKKRQNKIHLFGKFKLKQTTSNKLTIKKLPSSFTFSNNTQSLPNNTTSNALQFSHIPYSFNHYKKGGRLNFKTSQKFQKFHKNLKKVHVLKTNRGVKVYKIALKSVLKSGGKFEQADRDRGT
jgi:hypothetical protein